MPNWHLKLGGDRQLPYAFTENGIVIAKELLGWEPKVALKEGLARTIEYFRW